MPDLANRLRARLDLADAGAVAFQREAPVACDGFTRQIVRYRGLEGDGIPAFLFLPADRDPVGGVVVCHQHAGAFHLGKSEVAGLAGDPLQAFGPALARRGLAVLAPDAITFEDRRAVVSGTEPDDGDWLQHYNAMAYRLIDGDVLMRKVLDDAQRAVSVLSEVLGAALHDAVGGAAVGVAGHSYGGLVALYLAALDARCRFACVSGALCSFQARRRHGTGVNMFELVPGLAAGFEAHDVLSAIAPRPTMVVSATEDPYARDADRVVAEASHAAVTECRVEGEHALDRERFDAIVAWVTAQAGGA